MFLTCLTKDLSCFSLIEKANDDPGILTLDNKTRKSLSVAQLYIQCSVRVCQILHLHCIYRLEISCTKNVLWSCYIFSHFWQSSLIHTSLYNYNAVEMEEHKSHGVLMSYQCCKKEGCVLIIACQFSPGPQIWHVSCHLIWGSWDPESVNLFHIMFSCAPSSSGYLTAQRTVRKWRLLNISSKYLQVLDSHGGISEETLSHAYLYTSFLHPLLQIIQCLRDEREKERA